ncbi:hypothetical protein AX15_007441 [Amanita polypyramis BW_CC]|nr:hypothetical protein AX15_007441 [Amanita polypyramis BW_CC]
MSGSGTGAAVRQPAAPRSSASLIVVNQRNEILLVHRNPEARSFAGVHVFPGGNYDSQQDPSLEITAIRETFEESGVLLASPTSSESAISQSEWDEARHAVHTGTLSFGGFLDRHDLKPGVDSLLPFTEWTTPPSMPRRFRTQFFVAFLPATPSSVFSSGTRQERVPKPDGGLEVVSARFLHPSDVLSEFSRKEITLMPPQFYILYTLSTILNGTVNTQEQRDQVERLSRGAFGHLSLNPKQLLTRDEENKRGRMILTYEGDEARGGPPGRLHRVLVKFEKHGGASEIELQRNFDISTDLAELKPSSKL